MKLEMIPEDTSYNPCSCSQYYLVITGERMETDMEFERRLEQEARDKRYAESAEKREEALYYQLHEKYGKKRKR